MNGEQAIFNKTFNVVSVPASCTSDSPAPEFSTFNPSTPAPSPCVAAQGERSCLTAGIAALALWCISLSSPVLAAPTPAPAPVQGTNIELDPGVQGSMPRYKERDSSGAAVTQHNYMAPKNTPAMSLVDAFPWLFMNVQDVAQTTLYRGIGNNTGASVNNPLNLDSEGFTINNTNAGGSPDYQSYADVNRTSLNKDKCLKLKVNTGKCALNILDDTVGTKLGNDAYISRSPAVFNRLQMDSCTNQAIIPMGLNPKYVFNDTLRQHDAAYNETWCQPFKVKPVDCIRNRLLPITKCLPDGGSRDGHMYDYRAWGYLKLAWRSVLKEAYTPSGGAGVYYGGQLGIGNPPYLTDTLFWLNGGIPTVTGLNFPGVLSLQDYNNHDTEVPGEDEYGEPLNILWPGGESGPVGAAIAFVTDLAFNYSGNLTTINDLAERPYERIWDPTHPYSPRWDFKGTDRSFTLLFAAIGDSPKKGKGFSTSTSTCIVRCASVPVDIMSFRNAAFLTCMLPRININSAVFWQEVKTFMRNITMINIGFAKAVCDKLSMTKAINNTARDRILGPILGIIGQIKIPCVRHGRWKSNSGETIGVYIFGVRVLTIPSIIAGGCHFLMTGGTGFRKTVLHDTWNLPDDPSCGLANAKPAFLRQPQAHFFDSNWPICSTKYDVMDSTIHFADCLNADIASGDLNPVHGVRNCCDNLAHALAPINILKIRNTLFNPGLKPTPEGYTFKQYFTNRDDTRVAPDPPSVWQAVDPERPTEPASDYKSSHMPYMRWWDTGTASGGSASWVGIKDYDPDSDCGKYDTIVGVGTEDWVGDNRGATPNTYTATLTDKDKMHPAKYCRYGGNGFATNPDNGLPLSLDAAAKMASALGFGNLSAFVNLDLANVGIPPFYECIRLRTIDVANRALGPDAMTSWEELKLYQLRAMRTGLNCLPQYEKMHKPYSPEDEVLKAAGGNYAVPVLMNRSAVNNTEANDPNLGPDKGYYTVPYRGAPPANPKYLGSDPDRPGQINLSGGGGDSITMKYVAWPLAWRGYVSDRGDNVDGLGGTTNKACDTAFPNFSGDGGNFLSTALGLTSAITQNFTLPCLSVSTTGGNVPMGPLTWNVPGVTTPMGNVLGPSWVAGDAYPTGEPTIWPLLPAGLGKAEAGDIVFLNGDDIDYAQALAYLNWNSGYFTAPLPFTAYVESVHNTWTAKDGSKNAPVARVGDCPADEPNCFTECESSVTIRESNTGKFPDACGNTDSYGYGQPRTIYKEWLPDYVFDVIFPPGTTVIDTCDHSYLTKPPGFQSLRVADTTANNKVYYGISNSNYGSCADPKMSACTYADLGFGTTNPDAVNLWNHFRIYRPSYDIRQ